MFNYVFNYYKKKNLSTYQYYVFWDNYIISFANS